MYNAIRAGGLGVPAETGHDAATSFINEINTGQPPYNQGNHEEPIVL